MVKTVKIALFGVNATSNSRLATELRLALQTLALPVHFEVLQPCITTGSQAFAGNIHLCFLQAMESKPESPDHTLADQAIRQALNDGGQSYQVLYGLPNERLATAFELVRTLTTRLWPVVAALSQGTTQKGRDAEFAAAPSWGHACENCGDPQSERSLLSSLIAGRTETAQSRQARPVALRAGNGY